MDTVGSLIDKLVIVNLKIFKAEDIKREPGATDKTIADATRATNGLNQQRNDLINEINERLGDKTNSIKLYGRTT